MLIFGHPWIKGRTFRKVFTVDDIAAIPLEDIILLEPLSDSIALAQYCHAQQRDFAVTVSSITESLFVNALQGAYLVCQPEDAVKIQSIAQEYLFDTKVLTLISSEKEIQKIAESSIDGVIFPEAITVE